MINIISSLFFYFSGLVVNLACRGDYNVFPNQVKCRRKSPTEPTLEWSHKPVCYPSVLVSKTHWTKALHVRSVSCTGDSTKTSCSLSCIRDYVAVESSPYECTVPVCPAWTLGRDRSRRFVQVGHETKDFSKGCVFLSCGFCAGYYKTSDGTTLQALTSQPQPSTPEIRTMNFSTTDSSTI